MSNEQQILNLIVQYTYFVDQGEFDKVGELFAEGKLRSPGQELQGKEEVAAQMKKNLKIYVDGTPRTSHLNTNTILNIQDDKNVATASSYSYLMMLQDDSEKSSPLQSIAIGRYNDTFIRKNGK